MPPLYIHFFILLIVVACPYTNCTPTNPEDIRIMGIEPNSGPETGETRVLVRLQNFNKDLIPTYPHPSCRFGSIKYTVNATYVKCAPNPRKVGEKEPTPEQRTEVCIQCGNTIPHKEDIIPFTVSLLGDFTDTLNSVPFRFYIEPKITWIYPRYGPKDGGTFIEVYGENFLNYDQNLRCAFGSREVKAKYISDNYLTCISPPSDVVQKKLPFSISFNNQQNSKQDIPFVYYEYPQVFRLEPNRGPDTGGTVVRIRGQNFNPMIEIPEMSNHNDTFCKFGNLSLTSGKVISSTEMECVSPPSFEEREVPVEISLNNREWTDDGVLFYYYHPPFVYFINPKIGPVKGGTVVTITGSNFEDTGYVMCKFGDKYSQGTYVSQNELKCVAPPVEKPATVPLLVAIRPDEFSSGINTRYRYYDTPVISHIEPMCGPERGYTQITVYGENFPVGESNDVKCIFNRSIRMNATVMDDHTIKCDSPSVLNYDGVNENKVTSYPLELTLNGEDVNGPQQMFYYYKAPVVTGISPIFGPVNGGTTVNITGFDFLQKEACNITARFATYQVKPIHVEHNYMIVRSPTANLTGAVVVQVSLNGKQFEKDKTINYRDYLNTFYYYKCPYTLEMKPQKGPTIGGNDIHLYGVGYIEPYYAIESNSDDYQDIERKIYYRFVDHNDNVTVYGNSSFAIVKDSQTITIKAPKIVGKNNTVTHIELSYNNENFCVYNQTYTFFIMPNITSINPRYGPLKSTERKEITVNLDNYYCNGDCENIQCKYSSSNNIFIEKGRYVGPNTISCGIPQVNTPESYNVEASFNNGDDFTNNGHNYTFYDPYVIKVEPQMVSSKGNTTVNIYGYGFADSGKNLKVLYGSEDDETGDKLTCDYKDCVTQGEYVDSHLVKARTRPRKEITVDKTGEVLGYQRFPVEVSVYNDDFTNNNVTIFYYDEPIIINDLKNAVVSNETFNATEKEEMQAVLIHSLPCNVDTFIPIPVDSSKILKYYEEIEPFSNYTCKYESVNKDNKVVSKETPGIYTSYPIHSNKRNLFLCQSPKWNEVGKSKVRISLNGYDYSDTAFNMDFTEPIELYRIEPPCGPVQGKTQVKLYGTGFKEEKDYVFKWGPQNLVPMQENIFFGSNDNKNEMTPAMFGEVPYEIRKIVVNSPTAPDYLRTHGGLDYIALSKINFLPLNSFLKDYYVNNFIHTNFEYYYYHQIYVESFKPHGSVVTGGADVLVVGAWFQNKPEYGVKPYCQFGDKIVEGRYLSTVRIVCKAPPYHKSNVKVRFGVSLNKQDFVYAEEAFVYYNDFRYAKFEKVAPQSGPSTGGTSVKIYGTNFTGMVTQSEFMCQFQPIPPSKNETADNPELLHGFYMEPKSVPAAYVEYHETNETAILCNTPGGWASGTKADIKITFDGQNYMDTGFDFYFYKIDKIYPLSGPNTGEGEIIIEGGGFQDSPKVKFTLDNEEYKPKSVRSNRIVNPLPRKPANFTGYVDMGISLNGIDDNVYKQGFYYYNQPTVNSIYPHVGPSKGHALIKVYGEGFKSDFRGADIRCKAGDYYGVGEFVSQNEINCKFTRLPTSDSEYVDIEPVRVTSRRRRLEEGNENKKKASFDLTIALNGVSYVVPNDKTTILGYSVSSMEPSSGPITGGTRIVVKGNGFLKSETIRCRFGVKGYFSYTEAELIDYHTITCKSPEDFEIPKGGQIPFSVPFSIAFADDEFEPWTETSHFFTFYTNPEIVETFPKEGSTKDIVPVIVRAAPGEATRFRMPSASIVEEQYSVDGELKESSTFSYQPMLCKFGRFGTTEAEYINSTHVSCLTPKIENDEDIGYEEVDIEVAPNGKDFIGGKNNEYTFKGPNAGQMFWVYLLFILLGLLLIGALFAVASTYWNSIMTQYHGLSTVEGEQSQVQQKELIYKKRREMQMQMNEELEGVN